MRRLYWLLPVVSVLMLRAIPFDSTICSLTVEVYAATDQSRVESQVVVTDSTGKVRREQSSKSGVAKFCDLPFGDYRVLVGSRPCGQTEVREIKLGFKTERTIKVFDNGCPHSMFPTLLRRDQGFEPATCGIVVRVKADDGLPLAHVQAREGSVTNRRSDGFGRIWFSLAAKQALAVTLTEKGYADQLLQLKCGDSYHEAEQTVIMRRVEPH